ncbi:MAG: hypothetical protein ACJA1R_001918 [Flavobacteriales bacterium]|jgi:hypothetical protein
MASREFVGGTFRAAVSVRAPWMPYSAALARLRMQQALLKFFASPGFRESSTHPTEAATIDARPPPCIGYLSHAANHLAAYRR